MQVRDRLYIGGDWVAPTGPGTHDVISPVTEELIASVPEGTTADMDRAVAAAREAFDRGDWPRLTPAERAATVQRFAELYAARLEEMASVITDEMGCTLAFSNVMQAGGALGIFNYFLSIAGGHPWEQRRQGAFGGEVIVRQAPVGVVAVIAPWNVPQLVIASRLAPALLAGCAVVVKPSPETPLDAFLMADIASEAGFPPGVINIVPAGREVGEHLVRHPGVDKVGFTGSTAAGRRVGGICGEQLKRCTLELGGKSAAIVLDDADLAGAMADLRNATFMNNGESCVALTRVLASRRRYDEVVDALGDLATSLVIGDPRDPATELGPLFATHHRDRVEGYIDAGKQAGARIVTGGGRPPGLDRGWFVDATVFADVTNDMQIAREEIFGPVVVAIAYDDEADAVAIANDSDYGLAGAVYCADGEHGLDIARQIRTGTYGVNLYSMDFASPIGGFKASGIGRECGPEGLAGYVEYQSIIPGA